MAWSWTTVRWKRTAFIPLLSGLNKTKTSMLLRSIYLIAGRQEKTLDLMMKLTYFILFQKL